MFDFINVVVLYSTAAVVAAQLVAGGWVKIRDYFKARAAQKLAEASAEAAAKKAAIQALVAEAVEAAK